MFNTDQGNSVSDIDLDSSNNLKFYWIYLIEAVQQYIKNPN